jgi:hypothetical protein
MVANSKWTRANWSKRPHDRHIMGRHNDWGNENYSTDVDTVEKDKNGILRGWVNNKHGAMKDIDLKQVRIKDLHTMANLNDGFGQRPAWILVYFFFKKDGTWLNAEDNPNDLLLLEHAQYMVIPVNWECQRLLSDPSYTNETMTEIEYVEWLYTKVKNQPFNPAEHTDLFTKWNSCKLPKIINEGFLYG